MNNIGKVLNVVGANVLLSSNGKKLDALCPKQIKLEGLCAGDNVEFIYDASLDNNLITKLLERKNHIDRPNISNIDNAFITISEVPKPDFFVVDKILISLGIEKIEPYIIISKSDIISNDFIELVKLQYNKCVNKIIVLSSYTKEGLDEFINLTKDKISVLIGQSAVGKSSLLNALGIQNIKTDIMAKRVGNKLTRGKNTTKNCHLYLTDYGALVADTPGFKAINIDDLEVNEFTHYFVDIRNYAIKCKFPNCSHLPNNKGCEVIKALNKGEINIDRYNRFIRLKNKIIKDKKKYAK